MAHTAGQGRHRTPGRHNPLAEISGIVVRAGDTGVKASAVLAASGGLVAAFALPAQAAPAVTKASSTATLTVEKLAQVHQRVVTEPAVVAPALAAPMTVGLTGVTVEEKPPPPPPPVVVIPATNTGGRSAAAAPAQAVTIAANSGIAGIAQSLLGIPYVYGGATPSGFDCSGFTSYVYARAGISIPRTASAQQAAATRVSNPQPGDLVFFGYPAYHVGIYVGNGMMADSGRTGTLTSVRAIWDSSATFGRF